MSEVLLDVQNLRTYFPIKEGLMRRTVGHVHAVEDVSFQVMHREVFALVGESGCGKSTTGASILRLIEPTGGRVYFKGQDIAALSREEMRLKRRDMQFVFQNPYSSLNPRMNVRTLLSEPVRVHYHLPEKDIGDKVAEMMEMVGLSPDQLNRYPHQFSGGQKQRISIARALISRPSFVVADEPVSALDVSIQAQVVNLLEELQDRLGLTYIFVAHDLSMVRHISDRMVVMYLGKVMELADRNEIYLRPRHPYTRALMSAVPIPNPRKARDRQRILLKGDIPSPLNPPNGCNFNTRCPMAQAICFNTDPEYREIEPRHYVACHFA